MSTCGTYVNNMRHFTINPLMNQAGQGTCPLIPPPSGDFGVDFEHNFGNNQYLVQVKCKKNDIS